MVQTSNLNKLVGACGHVVKAPGGWATISLSTRLARWPAGTLSTCPQAVAVVPVGCKFLNFSSKARCWGGGPSTGFGWCFCTRPTALSYLPPLCRASIRNLAPSSTLNTVSSAHSCKQTPSQFHPSAWILQYDFDLNFKLTFNPTCGCGCGCVPTRRARLHRRGRRL